MVFNRHSQVAAQTSGTARHSAKGAIAHDALSNGTDVVDDQPGIWGNSNNRRSTSPTRAMA
jgi:hypothetical protein